MIFARKRDTPTPSWGLRINDSETDNIIVNDESIALRIVALWNKAEREAFDRHQNLIALERKPEQ